eukprot:6666739-Prymnesium_polylepis.1
MGQRCRPVTETVALAHMRARTAHCPHEDVYHRRCRCLAPCPVPAEAASDARYIHDMLRKMLRMPVFLDSSALNDMRKLITDG